MVGETVEVRILEISRGQVKIGVVAPREVGIFRSEIARLNRGAALRDFRDPDVKTALTALQKTLKEREG